MTKSWFILWPSNIQWGPLSFTETSEIVTPKYEGGETSTRESWFRLTMGTCLLSNQDKLWGDLAQNLNRNFFLRSGRRRGEITQRETVSERFCWTSRKVAIPMMCCERRQATGLKGTYCIFVCVWARVCTSVCVTNGPKACISSFFADKSCTENRDATHQLLGQRESKLSLWHTAERETGEGETGGSGGLSWNQCESQKFGPSNGHGWNRYSQWISGHSAMPKSPWIFSGSGIAAFQSLVSAHVCDSVLLRGLYSSRETHRKT